MEASSRRAAERFREIDFLRGVAIAGVAMRHVSWQMMTPQNLASPGGAAIAAASILSDVGVSLFIALSAFGLSWRHAERVPGATWLGFLRTRAWRLLPAYALWSLVSLAARDPSLLASPSGVASALLFGTADVQLYYVPMVFELYLLWPLVRSVLAARSAAGAMMAIACGFGVGELVWHAIVPSPWTPLFFFSAVIATGAVLPFVLGRADVTSNPFAHRPSYGAAVATVSATVAAALFAFCLERFLALSASATSRGALLFLAMMTPAPQALLNCSLVVVLAMTARTASRTGVGRWVAALGRHSYGVFLVHLLVASTVVYRLFATGGGPDGAGAVPLRLVGSWLAILVLSGVAAAGLARVPALAWTVGELAPRGPGRPCG